MTPLPSIRTFTTPHAFAAASSGGRLDRVSQDRDDLVDMAALGNQGRRHRKGIAALAQIKPAVEAIDHDVKAARARRVLAGSYLDGAHQAFVADVDHVRKALERMQRILPVTGERASAREQALVLVDVERRDPGRAG